MLGFSCSLARSRLTPSWQSGLEHCSAGAPSWPAISYGHARDLSGSLVTRPVPLPCSKTPAEPVVPGHGGFAAPDPTRRRLQHFHDFEANHRALAPAVYASRTALRPCKTRFRVAGSAFSGRASNLLGHDERFQVTSVLLSRTYPDARRSHVRRHGQPRGRLELRDPAVDDRQHARRRVTSSKATMR